MIKEVLTVHYDAGNGNVLLNTGEGGFNSLTTGQSCFAVPGEARSILGLKTKRGRKVPHWFDIFQVSGKRSDCFENSALPGIIDQPEYDFGQANKNLGEHRDIRAGQSEKSLGWSFD